MISITSVETVSIAEKHRGRLDGLTFLRFVAAFYVFIFHFDARFSLPLNQFTDNIVSNGAIAMPIFFMLSGFVLTYNYSSTYVDFFRYYMARIARIYPAYIFCTVVCLPLLPIFDYNFGPRIFVSVVVLLLIAIALVQSWFPNLFSVWHFSGTWSVSVEMCLYAVYPISRHLSNLSSKKILAVGLGLTLASASLIPSLSLSFSDNIPFSIFYVIPIYHIPEFLIGCGLATIYLRQKTNICWIFVGLLIIPFLGIFGAQNSRFMLFNGVILPMIGCAIIGFASLGCSKNKVVTKLVTNPVSKHLGETSYSFFLMQLPLLLLIDQHKYLFMNFDPAWLFIYFLIATQILASFSFHFVERPGQRVLLQFLIKRKHKISTTTLFS